MENDEERRAVAGLLALDDGLASTGSLTWSPAKSKDWTHLARGGFLGACVREVPDDGSPACATPPARSPPAALVEDMSPPAEYVERTESMNWMRESIVRDLKLLEDEEDRGRQLNESIRCRLPPSSPVPEEVSVEHGAEHGVEHEDSDASVAATTPACARSSTSACSSHAASPDCEAIPEQDCVAGHRKSSSPRNSALGDGEEWATRSGCVHTLAGEAVPPHGLAVGLKSHRTGEKGDNFPVFRYAKTHQQAAAGAARAHVSTAAAGAVRKLQRDLPPRSVSASAQRSPEAAQRSFRGSPSPTQLLPFSHDSSRGSPGSASRGDDNVIKFGSKKYVVRGRHGVAPWQEKAAPHDPAQHAAAEAAPVPSIAESRKTTNLYSNLNMMLRLQTRGGNKGAAVKAAASNAAGSAIASSRPPSIPTSSQCANITANLGALGVGGRALSAKSHTAAGERGKLRQISLDIAACAGEAGATLGKAPSRNFPQRDSTLHRVMKRAPNGAWAASRNTPAPSAAGAGAGGWR